MPLISGFISDGKYPGLLRRIFFVCCLALLMSVCATTVMPAETKAAGQTEVTGVRVGSDNDGKVRVVVDATKELKYREFALTEPNRIVIDINNAQLSPKVNKDINVGSLVKRIRVAQFDSQTVRLVIETDAHKEDVHIFTLANPERLVMDFGKVIEVSEVLPPVTKPVDSEAAKKKAKAEKKAKEQAEKQAAKEKAEKEKAEKEKAKKEKAEKEKDEKAEEDKDKKDKTPKSDGTIDEQIAELTGLKGRIIAIDAGHGGPDVGAIGPTGVTEKSVTLRVALELKNILVAEGANVVMTRTRDVAVSHKGGKATAIEELQARCDVANKKKADIFLSLHMDAFTKDTASGTTAYYYAEGAKESKKLADRVRTALLDQINTVDRGTQSCDFYVVRHTDMPAILLEMAFISHPKEEKFFDSDEGIKKAAQGIADGIADYFE